MIKLYFIKSNRSWFFGFGNWINYITNYSDPEQCQLPNEIGNCSWFNWFSISNYSITRLCCWGWDASWTRAPGTCSRWVGGAVAAAAWSKACSHNRSRICRCCWGWSRLPGTDLSSDYLQSSWKKIGKDDWIWVLYSVWTIKVHTLNGNKIWWL